MSLDAPTDKPGQNLPEKEWFSTKEVATYIDLCIDTIQRWVKKGTLKATRIEGRIYISRQELLRLLKGDGEADHG